MFLESKVTQYNELIPPKVVGHQGHIEYIHGLLAFGLGLGFGCRGRKASPAALELHILNPYNYKPLNLRPSTLHLPRSPKSKAHQNALKWARYKVHVIVLSWELCRRFRLCRKKTFRFTALQGLARIPMPRLRHVVCKTHSRSLPSRR